jgi:hypothetical protein
MPTMQHNGGTTWRDQLNAAAQQRMAQADQEVFEATQRMVVPAPYQLSPRDDAQPIPPPPGGASAGGGAGGGGRIGGVLRAPLVPPIPEPLLSEPGPTLAVGGAAAADPGRQQSAFVDTPAGRVLSPGGVIGLPAGTPPFSAAPLVGQLPPAGIRSGVIGGSQPSQVGSRPGSNPASREASSRAGFAPMATGVSPSRPGNVGAPVRRVLPPGGVIGAQPSRSAPSGGAGAGGSHVTPNGATYAMGTHGSGGRERRENPVPPAGHVQWQAAEGVAPVIYPPHEPPVDPGPGVIGIDR